MIAVLLSFLPRIAASLGLAAIGRMVGPLLGKAAGALGLPILGRAVSSFAGPLLGRVLGSLSWVRIALVVVVVLAIAGAVGWHVVKVSRLERAVERAEHALAVERLASERLRHALDEQSARVRELAQEAERARSAADAAALRRLHIPRLKPESLDDLNSWIARER